jgi:type I protein arginine methyltransferase
MYSLRGYAAMTADPIRLDAHTRALAATVRPGCVVADIGAGTGIMSLLACRLGARRVFAIEPDDAIEVAREMARVSGYSDRIEFFPSLSTRVDLPERADVVVADLRGVLPWHGQHLPAIMDARDRLLAPGGRLIPTTDVVWAAPVSAPAEYVKQAALIDGVAGFDWAPLRSRTVNTWTSCRLGPEALIASPRVWQTIHYAQLTHPNAAGTLEFQATRAGAAHGWLVWFDATLVDGIGFSNAPSAPATIYGSAFLPWMQPIEVEPGDTIRVQLEAWLVGNDYVWRWDTEVRDGAGTTKALLQQSSLQGLSLSAARLRHRSLDHQPALSEEGEIDRTALSLMQGAATVAEIGDELLRRFPRYFPDLRAARNRACDLSHKYAR